jgi:hypothetical protein
MLVRYLRYSITAFGPFDSPWRLYFAVHYRNDEMILTFFPRQAIFLTLGQMVERQRPTNPLGRKMTTTMRKLP